MDLDKKSNQTKFANVTKYINLVLIALVILIVGYFLYQSGLLSRTIFSYTDTSRGDIESDETLESVKTTELPKAATMLVDIQGAVKTPGVYEIDSSARLVDVIKTAGGFADAVDANYVAQNINQAQKLSDGMKIYIPIKGVEVMDEPIQKPTVSAERAENSTASGLVNMNTASQKELEALPEIGAVTAEKIISSRPYASLDELVKKGALKQSSYDKIKTLIKI